MEEIIREEGLITCTRRIQFCAGHRVAGHENKCANLHGHNYVAFFEAVAETSAGVCEGRQVDLQGRVIDFSVLKERLGGWVDRNWDHGMVLWQQDPLVTSLGSLLDKNKMKWFLLVDNPTAENMAKYLLNAVGPNLLDDTAVSLRKVTLWETENCYATVERV